MIQDLIACVIVFNVLLTALGLTDLVLSSVKFVANAFSVWLTVSNKNSPNGSHKGLAYVQMNLRSPGICLTTLPSWFHCFLTKKVKTD